MQIESRCLGDNREWRIQVLVYKQTNDSLKVDGDSHIYTLSPDCMGYKYTVMIQPHIPYETACPLSSLNRRNLLSIVLSPRSPQNFVVSIIYT